MQIFLNAFPSIINKNNSSFRMSMAIPEKIKYSLSMMCSPSTLASKKSTKQLEPTLSIKLSRATMEPSSHMDKLAQAKHTQ